MTKEGIEKSQNEILKLVEYFRKSYTADNIEAIKITIIKYNFFFFVKDIDNLLLCEKEKIYHDLIIESDKNNHEKDIFLKLLLNFLLFGMQKFKISYINKKKSHLEKEKLQMIKQKQEYTKIYNTKLADIEKELITLEDKGVHNEE